MTCRHHRHRPGLEHLITVMPVVLRQTSPLVMAEQAEEELAYHLGTTQCIFSTKNTHIIRNVTRSLVSMSVSHNIHVHFFWWLKLTRPVLTTRSQKNCFRVCFSIKSNKTMSVKKTKDEPFQLPLAIYLIATNLHIICIFVRLHLSHNSKGCRSFIHSVFTQVEIKPVPILLEKLQIKTKLNTNFELLIKVLF